MNTYASVDVTTVAGRRPMLVRSLVAMLISISVCMAMQAQNSPQSAKPVEGNIRVLKAKGTVTVTLSGKTAEPLKEGAFIHHDEVIKTGADSQAWLLFSNGTTVTVQPNSIFSVDKFLQIPFDSKNVDYKIIKNEPSVSQTQISVKEGTVTADVAKLNKGSTFKIGTPVGVAGIRGTLIQVTVSNTAGGSVSVSVNLPLGLSDFAATNGLKVTLTNGQTVTVSSDPLTGTITIGGVSPLSAQTYQQIQALAKEVAMAIPAQQPFEGVNGTAPELMGTKEITDQVTGQMTGDQGTGDVGTATPGGGTGGGGGGGGMNPSAAQNPSQLPSDVNAALLDKSGNPMTVGQMAYQFARGLTPPFLGSREADAITWLMGGQVGEQPGHQPPLSPLGGWGNPERPAKVGDLTVILVQQFKIGPASAAGGQPTAQDYQNALIGYMGGVTVSIYNCMASLFINWTSPTINPLGPVPSSGEQTRSSPTP